mgnify:CR=1 FL=1
MQGASLFDSQTLAESNSYTTAQSIAATGGYYRLLATNPYVSTPWSIKFGIGLQSATKPEKKHRDEVGNQCTFHTPPPTVGGQTCNDDPGSCQRSITLCPYNTFRGSCNQILKTDGIHTFAGASWEDVYYTTINCSGAGQIY